MLIYFEDQSDGISDIATMRFTERQDVRMFAYGDFGGGTVSIELYNYISGTWNTVPDLVFTEETGQVIELFSGADIRVNVAGCAGVTVELH